MKVRALPTCRKPVGEGAKRTRGFLFGPGTVSDIVEVVFLYDAISLGRYSRGGAGGQPGGAAGTTRHSENART